MTTVFVIAVDVILLATGLLTLSLPVLWLVQRLTRWNPSIDVSASSDTDHHTDPNPEPVPAPEQDPPPPAPEIDNTDRPLLDLVGRLAEHLRNQHRNTDDEMETIDIRGPADDTYRHNDDDDYDW